MTRNRLLVADDESDLAALIGRVAEGCGYEVTTCSEAETLSQQLWSFHATHIMLDLMMPGMDGIQALRSLAQAGSKAEILIFSGVDGKILESARRFGVESGLDIAGTVTKPIRPKELRSMLERLKDETDWLTIEALQAAIDRRELFLEYQPRLDLPSRRLAGAEALLRWSHPTRGLVPPGDFLPLAESDAIIDRITDYVVDEALTQVAAWRRDGFDCPVSINLSGRNIRDLDFADRLAAACARLDLPPRLVTLELTESAAMEDGPRAIDILTRLRLKGFELSIDDFGTGYSSLVQLHRLPFCEMKVDRTFIKECDASRDALVIVRTIVDLAHNLGLKACAEGVENEAITQLLCDMGCDRLQGFHIARPMRADRLRTWAAEHAMALAPAHLRQAC